MDNNVFTEYKENNLKELARLNACILDIERKYIGLLVQVTENKVKSGIWGLIGAAIPVIGTILLYFLYQAIKGAPTP